MELEAPIMKPFRIQRRRTKGWRMPPNTVYVGRPSKWGNRWKPEDLYIYPNVGYEIEDVPGALVSLYRADIDIGQSGSLTTEMIRSELRGKNLACWCPLTQPCHGDVLLEIANE